VLPVRELLGRARTRWRRSLQTRLVVTTLFVSGVVTVLLATLLLGQVGRGLVNAKTKSALVEAQAGARQAAERAVEKPRVGEQAQEQRLQAIAEELTRRGQTGDQYKVVLVSASGDYNALASQGVDTSDVPASLARRLDGDTTSAYAYRHGHPDTLVVGSTLTTPLGAYRLYHVFPLTAEQQTLGLVRRTAAVAGGLLVLLLALIAYLVARQVVLPVRLAAQTAERLAAGRLEERMKVRGEDELARLATTFNSMAQGLQSQIRQLEDLSRVQRRFVSDVTHELRTPITTVRMAADVLHEARADFPPATARSAELLQIELNRFENLLQELLEISRYDAGAATVDAEHTDLVALTARVIDATQALAARKGSEVMLRTRGPVIAEVDHVRVERVLRNLLVNAVEHGEGQPVEVTVAGGEDTVAVLVRDHGVGLRPGEAGLVFTRFWRGDPSRARTTGGTGLGLAIAQEDARLHGGTIQAWGAPGEGAAFRLTLPRTLGGPLGESPLPLRPAEARR
jgi:two-component system sensor histidine kinase MtrB